MAQLVERTLGKGEVLSSILSISTIDQTLNWFTAQGFLFWLFRLSVEKNLLIIFY